MFKLDPTDKTQDTRISHVTIFSIGVAPIAQVLHVRNKNSDIQGKSLHVLNVIFHTLRNCS